MVGDAGRAGRSVPGLRAAYDTGAGLWAEGPEPVYACLARALVALAGARPGGRVLDLGAGTGVAGRAALAAGARSVVCADSAAGLREARRVAAALAASSFAAGWDHPAKAAVDEVLAAFGYRPPSWYVTFKRDTEPWASDPAAVRRGTAAAGYTDVRLRTVTVATGLSHPAELAAWRLGMAHVAPFVSSLTEARRASLRRAAEAAVTGTYPLTVDMLVLTAF